MSTYTKSYSKIVQRLKQARKEANLTQSDVAELLKQYKTFISKIEKGERKLDVIEFLTLAKMYKKDILFFIQEDEE